MSVKLKKFKGDSAKQNVDIAADDKVMILTNPTTGQISLSIVATDGTTTCTERILNNVPEDKDPEEALREWIKNFSIDGSDSIEASLKGIVFASHNIVGLGRPIILENGVQLQKDHSAKPFVVSRYAKYYPDETVKARIIQDLKDANLTIRENMKMTLEDKEFFKEEPAELKKINELYFTQRADMALNNMKISCLQTPYVGGMSTAYISSDEKEIKEAFKNSGLDFDKFFSDGFEGGADNAAINEAEINAKGKAPAQQLAEEVAK